MVIAMTEQRLLKLRPSTTSCPGVRVPWAKLMAVLSAKLPATAVCVALRVVEITLPLLLAPLL